MFIRVCNISQNGVFSQKWQIDEAYLKNKILNKYPNSHVLRSISLQSSSQFWGAENAYLAMFETLV